jgi:histidinol-phosphate phosphatase family protein
MIPVLGKPLLEHQIALCRNQGFEHIALLVHYQHTAISNYFGDGSAFGVELEYLVEEAPRGTAGALRDALPRLAPEFLVLYGDTYLDVDLRALWKAHQASGASGTLFLHPNDHPQDSDLVEVDPAGHILAIHPYPHPEGHALKNLVNAGLYALSKEGLEAVLPASGKADLAKHTFPAMIQAGLSLVSYVSPEFIKDLGTPDRLDHVIRAITTGVAEARSGRSLRRAVFLDRDGTLNHEVDHLRRPDQLELFLDAAPSVQRINESGQLAVAVTNQPVVARGEVTLQGLDAIHARLEALLGAGHAYLDALYACPHHPHRGYEGEVVDLKIDCACRKPRTGLIDRACQDLFISREGSWIVGDSTSDMETGRRAGLRTMLVRTGYSGRDGKYQALPDYVAPDLASAIQWILEGHASVRTHLFPFAARHLQARTILIGGLSRSGKSSAAQVLKELFKAGGRQAHIIPLDSWLLPPEARLEGAGVISRYDIPEVLRCMRELADRSTRHLIRIPSYDPVARTATIETPIRSIGPEDLIILEGVPALAIPDLVSMADARVYLECPEPVRLSRLQRDYQWRGLSEDQVEALKRSRALDEDRFVAESRDNADASFLFEAHP